MADQEADRMEEVKAVLEDSSPFFWKLDHRASVKLSNASSGG